MGTRSHRVPARTPNVPDRKGASTGSRDTTTSRQTTRRSEGTLGLGRATPYYELVDPVTDPHSSRGQSEYVQRDLVLPRNVLAGLDVDIVEEGQAIRNDLLPSTSRATPSPTTTWKFGARCNLMIRGLVNGTGVSTRPYTLICRENTFPMKTWPMQLRPIADA